jgi:NADPH:quinone reductase-like Zn-dependent oxidoreductase
MYVYLTTYGESTRWEAPPFGPSSLRAKRGQMESKIGPKERQATIAADYPVDPGTDDKTTMRAIVYHRYGSPDVLELQQVEKPVVGDDDVLVQVRAASVNPYDWHFMRGEPVIARPQLGGLRKPTATRLGVDVAGEVVAVGNEVTEFRPGDAVFGACTGSFAEYAIARESSLVLKPVNVTFEQAGAVGIAAFTAIQALRDWGQVQPGQKVLINGAAGGVGTFAVQLARVWGAEVTGVCSTRNVEMVRSIGAHHVIDHTQEDFTRGRQRYDVMIDIIGNHSLSKSRRVLTPRGIYVMVGGPKGRWIRPLDRILRAFVLFLFVSQKLVSRTARWRKDDLVLMRELMQDGKVVSVIDRTYPLAEVPEAVRYLETGHAQGKVVINV